MKHSRNQQYHSRLNPSQPIDHYRVTKDNLLPPVIPKAVLRSILDADSKGQSPACVDSDTTDNLDEPIAA